MKSSAFAPAPGYANNQGLNAGMTSASHVALAMRGGIYRRGVPKAERSLPFAELLVLLVMFVGLEVDVEMGFG